MTLHLIQKKYAGATMSGGRCVSDLDKCAVCTEFNDSRDARFPFRVFLMLEAEGDIRVRERGLDTLDEAVEYADELLAVRRRMLIKAA